MLMVAPHAAQRLRIERTGIIRERYRFFAALCVFSPIFIIFASSLRIDRSYPRTDSSIGSPNGAIFFTKTSVPGVRPISTRRRLTAALLFETWIIVPRCPGRRSSSVFSVLTISRPYLESNSTVIEVPTPTSLIRLRRPPYNTVICFTIARPSPFPPVFLLRLLSTR